MRSRDLEVFEALGCASPREPSSERASVWTLERAVASLRRARDATSIRHRGRIHEMPSRAAMHDVVGGLAAVLFPTHLGRTDLTEETVDYFVGSTLHTTMTQLSEQARRALFFSSDASDVQDAALRRRARRITEEVVESLPDVRRLLVSDLEAAHEADGAAASLAEILVCSTGMYAVLHHRIAHVLHRAGLPFLARLVTEIGYAETGVYIHPGAVIGPRFLVDRGTGVVIGETATVGANVRIHQGVTLGTLDGAPSDTRHHPRVEDDVVIHAGATLLGPITIGARSTIGGNVWLTESVRAGSVVTQAAARGD